MDRLKKDCCYIGVVLLASGLSRRMGVNKLLLPLGEMQKPCIRIVAESILGSGVSEVVVVYQANEIVEVLKDLPIKFIQNSHSDKGQSEAVKLGAAHPWTAEVKAIAFCMGDQPLLESYHYRRMFQSCQRGEGNIAIPCVGEESFSPVIFDLLWRKELLNLSGDRGGKVLLRDEGAVVQKVFFEDRTIFMDMDVPEDYEALKELMNFSKHGGKTSE